MTAAEYNFDGLVGPTHNYAGLSHGNVASMTHRGNRSNPREAALQGLAKMKALADLGVPQAVLPPHERPSIETLRRFGFTGPDDAAVLRSAAREAPELLTACSSASSMWVANAATVTPSADAADGRVHFTPANLVAKFHRSIEPPQTQRTLCAIFRDPERFVVHAPVPGGQGMGDEGAANHTRFAAPAGSRGLHLFVHGHRALRPLAEGPQRFPSRQSFEAFDAIRRQHGLANEQVVFAQQHPAAIDAGVFHNDVIAVGHADVFLYHEHAYVQTTDVIEQLRARWRALYPGRDLTLVPVPDARVPIQDAVQSYLFNSQLVSLPDGGLALIAPTPCAETPSVRTFLDELTARADCPIRRVHHFDLRQSMRNGGGPACLRLRVVLNDRELAALPPQVRLNETMYGRLTAWVRQHYRDELGPEDLADPRLLEETRRALDELTQLLGLGSIYPFQLAG